MTKIEETKTEGLKRAFKIVVPQAELEAALSKRLEEIGKKAKIQGFRPGKAPLAIIRQHYAHQAQHEVIDQVINDSVHQTLTERKLRPAVQPKVDALEGGEEKDLSFTLEVEVLPEIKQADFAKMSFERQVADVAPKTIDEAVERIAKSMHQPEEVTEKRAAKMGDTVEIDFDGSVDGKSEPGMKAENHSLELGSHALIDTFEDQIVGMKVGDKKDIKVTFPDDYHAEHLSGKKAVFAVALKKLLAHKPVEVNEALATEIGFPSMDKLRERIADDIAANYAQISRLVLKRALMDKLADAHAFDLPESMVESEFDGIWEQVQKDKAEGHLSPEDAKKSDKALKDEYLKIAQRRVRLGLLLADVAEKNKIEVAPTEMRNAMIAEARRFPGQEKLVVDYYTKNPGAIERLRAPLLEDKVVDFVLALAKITEKKIDAEELIHLPEKMED